MADKTLRIAIDSTQAEAGAKRIVASMKEIQREAAKTVGIKVPIKIDTTGIAAAMAEVNKALRDISGTSADVKIPVGFDTSKLDSETADLVRKIKAEVDRNTADGIPVEASLKVATDAAEAEINRVLGDRPDAIEIPVDIDATQARAEIDALSDSVGGRNHEIKVDLDTSDAVSGAKDVVDALDDINDALGDLSGEASKSAKSLKEIEDAAKKAASAADDMGDAFKGALQQDEMLELVGEALLAIATSIGTAIVAFEDYQDAVRAATGDSEAAGVAMEMIEQFAADTAFSIEDVTAAFVKFRSAGLEASKESLTSYGNVAAGLNLTMEELAAAVGQAAQGNFSKLNDTQLKAVESGDKVKFTYQGVTTEVANTGKAVAAFIKTMGNTEFAGLMEEQADGVTGALEAMAEAWHELSRDMGEGGLSQGLIEFSHSMRDASEAADQLGRLLGSWLGAEMTALGNFVETTVKEINALIDAFKWLGDAIDSLPSISGALSGAKDWLSSNVMPNLLVKTETPGEDQGPPTDPNRTNNKAFGSDTNLPRKPGSTKKTEAQRQAERFADMSAGNKELLRTLKLVDESYERGRYSVEGFRNSIDETTQKIALQKSVGKENAQAILDQAMEIKAYKENIAFKGEVLDQSEAIAQTDELADAFLQGSAAVQQTEARIKAYNTAVGLGMSGSKDIVDQLYKLADAAAMANARLSMSKDIAGMDEEINQTKMMTEAIHQGRAAEQDAATFAEARAMAVKGGYENDIIAVRAIEEKIKALNDEKSHQELLRNVADRDDELQGIIDVTAAYQQGGDAVREAAAAVEARNIAAAAGRAGDQEWIGILQGQIMLQTQLNDKLREQENLRQGGFDLEQGYAEIELLNLSGEQYLVGGERLDMLMRKKRETGDATATLTAEEEALAEALGRMSYQSAIANDALSQLARESRSTEQVFRDATAQGLGHFEDALVDIVTGTKSAREAFADMAKSIAADLARMAIKMAIIRPLAMMFGGGMGMGAAPVFGGFASAASVGPITWGSAHTGGIMGVDTQATISPFANLPRYHNGGLAGNEVPAVLTRGEGVFTPEQMKNLQPVNNNSTSAPTIIVNVQQAQGGDSAQAKDQGNIIAKQVEMAMQEFTLKNQRPGGMFNPNGGY